MQVSMVMTHLTPACFGIKSDSMMMSYQITTIRQYSWHLYVSPFHWFFYWTYAYSRMKVMSQTFLSRINRERLASTSNITISGFGHIRAIQSTNSFMMQNITATLRTFLTLYSRLHFSNATWHVNVCVCCKSFPFFYIPKTASLKLRKFEENSNIYIQWFSHFTERLKTNKLI